MDKLEWTALEYAEKEHDQDWYWALGIIVVTSTITAIIFENYFFAVLLFLAGALLWFFSKKKPDLINYEINLKGIKIGNDLYTYDTIQSYWISRSHIDLPDEKDLLFIKSSRFYMPILIIPISTDIMDDVHNVMDIKNIPAEEMRPHISDKIIEVLGF